MDGYQVSTDGKIQNQPEHQSNMNFFQRLIGIIVSPIKTIDDLIEKPRILFPILSMGFGLLVLYLLRYELYTEYVHEALVRSLESMGQTLAPEQIEAYLQMTVPISLISSAIVPIITWFVITAVIFGVVKIFKGEGSFKQYLSILGYAGVVTLLYYIICIATSFMTGKLMLDASLTNITNLFMPDIRGTYVYGIIRSIGLFSIWYYALVAVGVARLSKISKEKVFSMVTVIFIIEVLVNAMENRYL